MRARSPGGRRAAGGVRVGRLLGRQHCVFLPSWRFNGTHRRASPCLSPLTRHHSGRSSARCLQPPSSAACCPCSLSTRWCAWPTHPVCSASPRARGSYLAAAATAAAAEPARPTGRAVATAAAMHVERVVSVLLPSTHNHRRAASLAPITCDIGAVLAGLGALCIGVATFNSSVRRDFHVDVVRRPKRTPEAFEAAAYGAAAAGCGVGIGAAAAGFAALFHGFAYFVSPFWQGLWQTVSFVPEKLWRWLIIAPGAAAMARMYKRICLRHVY